jgi:GTP-binding protein EngB required for normal cell division
MKKLFVFFTIITTSIFLFSCQTVTKKIDEKTAEEEKELSKWLNQPESELKIVFGKPDKIEFTNSRNRYYIYTTKKLKIKCERKFEINPKNIVVGFSSKNCF